MEDLEKFMYSLHCSQISWEELCQMYLNKEAENEDLKQKIKEIGEKYSKATEYYDEFIAGSFVELPPTAKKFVNQIGNEILQIL